MLGSGLRVPIAASRRVLETITQLASLVTIHSEIDDFERAQKSTGKGGRGGKGKSSQDAGASDAPSLGVLSSSLTANS